MNFKFVEGVKRCNCMLPDVSNYVEEVSFFEHIDRVRGHPILHVYISCLLVEPIWLVFWHQPSDCKVFVLGGKSGIDPCFLCSPLAEGTSFEVVDFSRPVPGHFDLSWKGSQKIFFIFFDPKHRHLWFDRSNPPLPFLSPKFRLVVASILDKLHKLSVGNQHLTSLELLDIKIFVSKLIVPAKGSEITFVFAFILWNFNHFIDGNLQDI